MNQKVARLALRFCLCAVVITVLAFADAVIQRIAAALDNDVSFLLHAFVLTQFSLLGAWVVKDSEHWSIRLFSVVLAAWLLEFVTVEFTTTPPGLSLLFVAHAFVLAVLLVALRWRGTFPWHHAVGGNVKHPFPQFTIRDALLFVAAIAFLLFLCRWLLSVRSSVVLSIVDYPLPNIFMLFLFGACTAVVTVVSLWLFFAPNKVFSAIALGAVVAAAGLAMGVFRFISTWVACAFSGLQAVILISTLAVGRNFGGQGVEGLFRKA